MAATIYADVVKGAVAAVRNIKDSATFLLGVSETPFNTLQSRLKAMRDSHVYGLNPVFAGAATNAQINTIFGNHLAGWGTTPAQSMNAVRTEMGTLYGAANTLLGTIEDPVSVDGAGNIVYATVPVTSLHASLQTVLDAANVLEG